MLDSKKLVEISEKAVNYSFNTRNQIWLELKKEVGLTQRCKNCYCVEGCFDAFISKIMNYSGSCNENTDEIHFKYLKVMCIN